MPEVQDPGTSAHLVGYIRKQLKRFESNLRIVMDTADVEAVHDLRVASRRLGEPLMLLEEWIGRKASRRARRTLRKVRAAFRDVRDLDVMQHALVQGGNGDFFETDELASLEGLLTRRRQRAMEKARRRCERLEPIVLPERILRACAPLDEPCESRDRQLADVIREQVERRVGTVLGQDARKNDRGDLHELRIAVKRLRYTLELSERVFARSEADAIDRLAEAQDVLGHWNDCVTAAAAVARISVRRTRLATDHHWSSRLLRYAARQAEAAGDARRKIIDLWPQLDAALRPLSNHGALDPDRGEPDAASIRMS